MTPDPSPRPLPVATLLDLPVPHRKLLADLWACCPANVLGVYRQRSRPGGTATNVDGKPRSARSLAKCPRSGVEMVRGWFLARTKVLLPREVVEMARPKDDEASEPVEAGTPALPLGCQGGDGEASDGSMAHARRSVRAAGTGATAGERAAETLRAGKRSYQWHGPGIWEGRGSRHRRIEG